MQYAISLVNRIPTTFVSIGQTTSDGVNGLIDLSTFLVEQSSPPTVVTFNFGQNENGLTRGAAT